MTTVWIVADGTVDEQGQFIPVEKAYLPGITALQQAIAASGKAQAIRVVSPETIATICPESDHIVCPLTLYLPTLSSLPDQAVYPNCRDVEQLRQKVQAKLNCKTGTGAFWLPVVLTARGPLYAEVIGTAGTMDVPESDSLNYCQPVHLSDNWRQPLYRFGRQILQLLAAPPSVYLVQFGFQGEHLCFDRLFPFPAIPAIASLGMQTPDLFECYWRCLTHQPILDLSIATTEYQPYEPGALFPASD